MSSTDKLTAMVRATLDFEKLWLSRFWRVARRVMLGAYQDGFIHAGNLAYLSLLALFAFVLCATAIAASFGRTNEGLHALEVILATMPPGISRTLDAPVREVIGARNGHLLWIGAAFGLWTVASLIETLRDILRRAYGTQASQSFWKYRVASMGLVVGAVLLLLISFSLQVVTLALGDLMARFLPPDIAGLGEIALTRGISLFGLFIAMFTLFVALTPQRFRGSHNPKWPGALATTLWWLAVSTALPHILARLISYDLTYGSLAGVMVTLFFFYLVGLGMVIGAELNAALASADGDGQRRPIGHRTDEPSAQAMELD